MNTHVSFRDQLAKVDPTICLATITHEFEELGIEIVPGFSAGSFSGSAELDIFSQGFDASEIWLDVSKLSLGKWECQRVKLEQREHPQLWSAIERALQKQAAGNVDQYIERLGG